ncbi:TIGR01777 family oxidoreductase [Fontibacillus sp. BL9]|uniref:TIGR01777 family oxidoreductase n=1 Tax=Fontibacillus sp. BL9 TaxID=3389971 RepID=UPI003979102C
MKYVIFGGTGFIGQALTGYWMKEGHEVIIVSRNKDKAAAGAAGSAPAPAYRTWDELGEDPTPLEGANAFVNLAGATLSQRWSRRAKQNILESRLHTTREVARLSKAITPGPDVILQASAVGIYGTSLMHEFTEKSQREPEHNDFLSGVTEQWEAAADEGFAGRRLVKLRTGVVLGNGGGAFPLMRLPFLLGVGGRIGSGRQWVPWIHLNDLVRLIDFCIQHSGISGPVNAVSPYPVSNQQFGSCIARVYRRPDRIPLPGSILKLLLGEMSSLLLEGQKVVPEAALQAGFTFAYPGLEEAMTELKSKK